MKLDKIKINKNKLTMSLTQRYNKYKNGKRNGVNFLNIGEKYEIDKVYQFYSPDILDRSMSYNNGKLEIYFENSGWECDLIKIENIHGDLVWIEKL